MTACALLASGCFRYVPAQLEAVPAGDGVRVLVTQEGARELAAVSDVQGAGAPTVRGTLVGREGDDLLLSVAVAQRQDAFTGSRLNQTIRVPVGEILNAERRELDGLATAAAVGGGAAVIGAVVAFIVKPFGRDDPQNNDDPDDFLMRFNLLSIPFGR